MANNFARYVENLTKTPKDRRLQSKSIEKLLELEELWLQVPELERTPQQLNLYQKSKNFIATKFTTSNVSGNEDLEHEQSASNNQSNPLELQVEDPTQFPTMADFDLKVASTIVPEYNGTSDNLIDFLDCARYYNETLGAAGKPLFLKYLLKVKLKEKAKTALTATPENFGEFEKLLKARFRPRATIASLQNELSVLQQRNKTISDFATQIESITATMTELHVSEKGEASREIIRSINDTMALSVLKKGVKQHIQQVLLAGQVADFNHGVALALEAESSTSTFSTVDVNYLNSGYYNGTRSRGRNNYRGRGRGRGRNNYNAGYNGNHNNAYRGGNRSNGSYNSSNNGYQQTNKYHRGGRGYKNQRYRGGNKFTDQGNGKWAAPSQGAAKVTAVQVVQPNDQ